MSEIFFTSKSKTPHPVPLEALLIDAKRAAAMGSFSLSWWLSEVCAGRAPAPVIRKPRCTRWRASDVRAFWQQFAEQAADVEAAKRLIERNKRASLAAQRKRADAGAA